MTLAKVVSREDLRRALTRHDAHDVIYAEPLLDADAHPKA